MQYAEARKAAIAEIKRMIAEYDKSDKNARIIGGPFNLSSQDLLREVELDTEIGRGFVQAFSELKKPLP